MVGLEHILGGIALTLFCIQNVGNSYIEYQNDKIRQSLTNKSCGYIEKRLNALDKIKDLSSENIIEQSVFAEFYGKHCRDKCEDN